MSNQHTPSLDDQTLATFQRIYEAVKTGVERTIIDAEKIGYRAGFAEAEDRIKELETRLVDLRGLPKISRVVERSLTPYTSDYAVRRIIDVYNTPDGVVIEIG